MTRLTVRLFGFPVLTFDLTRFEVFEDAEEPAFGGGSGHNFTIAAPYVDERYLPWEEDRYFGFGDR